MHMRRAHLTMRTEGITAFSNRYGVVVWTGQKDTKAISMDANLFENGAKQLRFCLKTDESGQGLRIKFCHRVPFVFLKGTSAILASPEFLRFPRHVRCSLSQIKDNYWPKESELRVHKWLACLTLMGKVCFPVVFVL